MSHATAQARWVTSDTSAGRGRRSSLLTLRHRSELLRGLAWFVVAVVVLQLVLLVVAGFAARQFATRSANAAVVATASVITQHIDDYFTHAVVAAGPLAFAVGHDATGPEGAGLPELLYQSLAHLPQLAAIHVIRADGSSMEVTRSGDGYVIHTIVAGADGREQLQTRDASFGVVTTTDVATGVDPRAHSEYAAIAASQQSQWFGPEIVDGESRISYGQPAFDASGTLVATVSVDVNLHALIRDLSDAPVGSAGSVVLVDGDQRVVAAPSQFAVRVRAYEEANARAMPLADLGLKPASSLQSDGTGATLASQRTTGGWIVREQQVVVDGGPDLLLFLQVRREETMPGLSSLYTVLRGIALALGISVVLTPVIAWRVRRPLSVMATRAARDQLTGIANRDEVQSVAPRKLELSREAGQLTCVVMMDVDNFKALNDVYGHDAGDRALVLVGEALYRGMRSDDVCGRWGGDEFILLISVPSHDIASSAADRLRLAAEEALISEFPGLGLGVTAGYAVSGAEDRDFAVLTTAADEALVSGKRDQKSRLYAAV